MSGASPERRCPQCGAKVEISVTGYADFPACGWAEGARAAGGWTGMLSMLAAALAALAVGAGAVALWSIAHRPDAGLVERVLGSVGLLEFTPVPPGCILFIEPDEPAPRCLAGAEPLFDGTEVAAARVGQDQTTGEIVVNLEFKEAGARLFDEHAQEHLGDHFAIVLDGIVETAPSINATRFGGQAQISGLFTVEEASALVDTYGAMRQGNLFARLKAFYTSGIRRQTFLGTAALLTAVLIKKI